MYPSNRKGSDSLRLVNMLKDKEVLRGIASIIVFAVIIFMNMALSDSIGIYSIVVTSFLYTVFIAVMYKTRNKSYSIHEPVHKILSYIWIVTIFCFIAATIIPDIIAYLIYIPSVGFPVMNYFIFLI